MAFNKQNMASLGGNAKNTPKSYSFYNKDDDTVTAAKYADWDRLRVGDQVVSISADYTTRVQYYVSAVATEQATLIASS
jgi:hypothetical protein